MCGKGVRYQYKIVQITTLKQLKSNQTLRETVGNVNEETIKKYIGEQYERDRMEGDSGK